MLLLGAGESGKSTIFKQLKILNTSGFSEQDRVDFKKVVHFNIICSIQDACKACKTLGIHYGSDDNQQRSNLILTLDPKTANAANYQTDIEMLWKDSGVRTAMTRTNEFYIIDSAKYFLESVGRVCQKDYTPTDQDILRCRKATNGIVSMEFKHDQTFFKVYDVGGQRGKRKKWIQCFDGVTAIIFVASLSEYDQSLMEMKGKNRMEESLKLFEGITSLAWFRKTPIILFLNKKDIFQEKIKNVPLRFFFDGYESFVNGIGSDANGSNPDVAMAFIRGLYEQKKTAKDCFYCHLTCATDTDNMKFVMKATVDIIMKRCLENYGLAGSMY